MTTHVFVGPTIAEQTVSDRLPAAIVHPPVRHGDLLALALQPGDVVAIIDGVFFRTGAIRHKELLHLLQSGVEVWGASSMGALRAAELDVFGMRGVGSVYDLYANGVITADDEVAVMHADADSGYRTTNEALVTVRQAAQRAREREILTLEEEQSLLRAAKGLFFADRTYPRVIESARSAGLSANAAAGFADYVATASEDVKRQDAELLLDELRHRLADSEARSDSVPPQRPKTATRQVPRMEMTSFLLRWMRATPHGSVDGVAVSDMAALTACQLFADDYPGFHYRAVLRELVRGELGAAAPDDEDDLAVWEHLACKAAARRGLIVEGASEVPDTLHAWVGETPRDGAVEPVIARALVRSYRWAPNVRPVEPLVDALAGTDAWTMGQRQAARATRLNEQIAAMKPSFNVHYISDEKLQGWLKERWGTTKLRFSMLDRGFASNTDLRARAAEFLALDSLQGVPSFSLGVSDPAR